MASDDVIKLRGDVQSQWDAINPVLRDREVALITDEQNLRVGNGVDDFSTLPNWLSGTNFIETDVVSQINDTTVYVLSGALTTLTSLTITPTVDGRLWIDSNVYLSFGTTGNNLYNVLLNLRVDTVIKQTFNVYGGYFFRWRPMKEFQHNELVTAGLHTIDIQAQLTGGPDGSMIQCAIKLEVDNA